MSEWEYNYRYVRGAGRPELRGQKCRIIETWSRYGRDKVMIGFTTKQRFVCLRRCIRRLRPDEKGMQP